MPSMDGSMQTGGSSRTGWRLMLAGVAACGLFLALPSQAIGQEHDLSGVTVAQTAQGFAAKMTGVQTCALPISCGRRAG